MAVRGDDLEQPISPDRRAALSRIADRFDLSGRVAMVTGASSDLGATIAQSLSDAGARVVVVGRRLDRLQALAERLGGTAVACDLLDEAQVTALVPGVVDSVGPPEILVNVAGDIFSRDAAQDEPTTAIRRTFELNAVVPFRLCQDVFPHMARIGRGSVVNISSISGMVGMPGAPQASYAASKQALSGMTTELAVQWASQGIRINTVAPGFFRSEINEHLYQDPDFVAWLDRSTPLRADARSEDFDTAVLWLASDAARHITGQTLVIDGGWTIQ